MRVSVVVALVVCLWCICGVECMEDMYCGEQNCYQVLGVDRDATAAQIKRAFRKMSLKYHPDKNKDPAALDVMVSLNQAYEIVGDEATRKDYDDYLDNPQSSAYNKYRYYAFVARMYGRRYDWRKVVIVIVSTLSALTYGGQYLRFSQAQRYLGNRADVRARAKQIADHRAREKGWSPPAPAPGGKKKKAKTKLKVVEEDDPRPAIEEEVVKELIAQIQVHGGYRKPRITDVFVVWVLVLPVRIGRWAWWHLRWQYRHTLNNTEYDEEERVYLTQRTLGLSPDQWLSLEEDKRQKYMERDLWIAKNYEEFQRDERIEANASMPAWQRRAMRYMRKR